MHSVAKNAKNIVKRLNITEILECVCGLDESNTVLVYLTQNMHCSMLHL